MSLLPGAGLPTILCVVGTRPECIKMGPVIAALRRETWCRTLVLSTGQHRQLVAQTLGFFGVSPDIDLDTMTPNQTLATLTGRILDGFDGVLTGLRPDLVLLQGDTTTVMACALGCFYRRVPFGHVEAGLRTRDLANPFPEEFNRRAAGLLASLHFAPTAGARANLLAEGVPDAAIHLTGNTVIDALLDVTARPATRLPFAIAEQRRVILVTAHRRENFGAPLADLCQALRGLVERYPDVEIVYPVHPNPNVREPVHAALAGVDRIRLVEPLGYLELAAVMKRCTLVLTDSGGIQEEAPALGKPVLVLRRETERPEAIEAGVARLVGTDPERIMAETSALLDDPAHYGALAQGASPYGDGLAAPRIVAACAAWLRPGAASGG